MLFLSNQSDVPLQRCAAGETTRKNAPLLFYASLRTSILQLMTTK